MIGRLITKRRTDRLYKHSTDNLHLERKQRV